MISLRAERFAKWPDEEEANGFLSDITSILGTVVNFLSQTGELIPISEITGPIATQINQSVVKAWQDVIWPDYNGDPNDSDDRAGKYEWQTLIKRIGFCTDLVEKAINLCDEDDDDDIQRYENLVFLHKSAIDSCSWDYNITDWGKSWHKEWSLTDEAKNARRKLISQYEAKVNAIKSAKAEKERAGKERKGRIAHLKKLRNDLMNIGRHILTKKASLEKRKKNLSQQISAFNQDIKQIPGDGEIEAVA